MDLRQIFDVIVVGSGPSGAMAAQTLVERGANVAMLDVGYVDKEYEGLIPRKDFISIRETEKDQSYYFLGKRFEGINFGEIKSAAQLTPPRQFAVEGVDKWLPTEGNLERVESLAYGGLGSAWGLACFTYSDAEIKKVGLPIDLIKDAYGVIARRIGISGACDDTSLNTNDSLLDLQPPSKPGAAMAAISLRYKKRKTRLKKMGVTLKQTSLALLTEPLNGRDPTNYLDMDFWSNEGKTCYRPAITINQLKQKTNFSYLGRRLVMVFAEQDNGVEILTRNIDTGAEEKFFCKKLVLAAGALGTARIIMRSCERFDHRFPIVSDMYSYFVCAQPSMFGKKMERRKISHGGVSLFYDEGRDGSNITSTQLYTYSSLMSFRLVSSVPFNLADTIKLLKFGLPSLVIAGVHYSDRPSIDKFIMLKKDPSSPTGDKLVTHCKIGDEELLSQNRHEKVVKRALRLLGCYPIKRFGQKYGASIHYGGTIPFSKSGDPLTLSPLGKLSGAKNIFVADGSGWNAMPGKGPTLTFMANAHVVASNIEYD